jgi:pyrroloquinoline quinone biosynthesis protein B
MKVRVLGTAAGGGWPQWNCACAQCGSARERGLGRTQDCVAVSGDGRAWYLLNASPDLRAQLLAAPELAPGPGLRETPLRGVLLTTAELDHALGLLTLREAVSLAVYATAPVTAALSPVRAMLEAYTTLDWHVLESGRPVDLEGGLIASAVPLGAKRPRYAQPVPADDWVVAYRILDARTGGVLVYAPCLPEVTTLPDADLTLVDGTFLTEDEMARETGRDVTATAMGHVPIERTRPLLPGTALYTHLNNTNPLVHSAPSRPMPSGRGATSRPMPSGRGATSRPLPSGRGDPAVAADGQTFDL